MDKQVDGESYTVLRSYERKKLMLERRTVRKLFFNQQKQSVLLLTPSFHGTLPYVYYSFRYLLSNMYNRWVGRTGKKEQCFRKWYRIGRPVCQVSKLSIFSMENLPGRFLQKLFARCVILYISNECLRQNLNHCFFIGLYILSV